MKNVVIAITRHLQKLALSYIHTSDASDETLSQVRRWPTLTYLSSPLHRREAAFCISVVVVVMSLSSSSSLCMQLFISRPYLRNFLDILGGRRQNKKKNCHEEGKPCSIFQKNANYVHCTPLILPIMFIL